MSDLSTSDLAGPVAIPTGPTEGAAVASTTDVDSIVGLPELHEAPPVASSGEILLAVESPWRCDVFDAAIAGCPAITRRGTSVPAALADQVVSIGAANGITIVKR